MKLNVHTVPNCSKLFQTVPNCSKLFQTVPNCSKLFQTVLFFFLTPLAVYSQSNYSGMPPTFSCGVINSSTFTVPHSDNFIAPNAICTDPNSIKWVRVNIHFVNRDDGTGNFNQNDDGNGNSTMNGYKRAELLINRANDFLANNQHMWRPSGNNTAVIPTRIRYLLTGVYFHNSSNLTKSYVGSCSPDISDLHNAFGVNTGSEINYYYTRSESIVEVKINNVITYECRPLEGNGVGASYIGAGISSVYGSYLTYPDFLDMPANLMNHEIGHILTLAHTWNENDGCEDTPRGFLFNGAESQCFGWVANPNDPCNNWTNISNNVMDYNSWQSAYTPCQIGRIHNDLNGSGNQYVHSCNGCTPANSFFDLSGCFNVPILPPNIYLSPYGQELYLNGEASVNENSYKIEICEVSSLGNSSCIGNSYNSGWLSGQVGKINLKSMYNFSPNKFYKIDLAVASSSCSGVTNLTKYIMINSGICDAGRNIEMFTRPNPANTQLIVKYKLPEDSDTDILLFDSIGNIVKSIKQKRNLAGDNENTIDTTNLREGVYILVLKAGEKIEKKTIYVNH
jgi:hypothetical protein